MTRVLLLCLILVGCREQKPGILGPVTSDLLQGCYDDLECLSSHADAPSKIVDPISFKGSILEAKMKLLRVLERLPGFKVVKKDLLYIRGEHSWQWFGFIDDYEFLIDQNKRLIYMRGTARLTRPNMGVISSQMLRVKDRYRQQTLKSPFKNSSKKVWPF